MPVTLCHAKCGAPMKDKLFLDYDERGKKQYSNTLYTYVRFLKAKYIKDGEFETS